MTGSVNSKMFDLLLMEAFLRYEEKLNGEIPSDTELSVRYPLPEKEKRSVVKYQKKVAKEKKYGRPMYVVFLRRAVAIVLIAVSVLFGSLLMNEKVRAAVSNAIVQIFEKYVKLIPWNTEEKSDSMNIYDYDVLSHIPDGYETVKAREIQTMREFGFVNEEGYDLYVCVRYDEGFEISIDNDNSIIEMIEIDGNEAFRQIELSEEPPFVSVIVIKGNIVFQINGYENYEIITEIAEKIVEG